MFAPGMLEPFRTLNLFEEFELPSKLLEGVLCIYVYIYIYIYIYTYVYYINIYICDLVDCILYK